jgi:hypothetical protein
MTTAEEDLDLFEDLLADFGSVAGMSFANRDRDIVVSNKVTSFEMQGNNYDRQVTREIIGRQSDNADLILLWNSNTPQNKPIVVIGAESFQLADMANDEVLATVKFLGKLLQ